MIKRVALIELYQHSEVLRTFAQLFSDQGWEVRIWTNSQVREDLYELEIRRPSNGSSRERKKGKPSSIGTKNYSPSVPW